MHKPFLHDFLRIFLQKKKNWAVVSIDKLFFESQMDHYFLVLKALGKSDNKNVFLTIGNVFEENIFSTLFLKKEENVKVFQRLGIKIKKIRLLKKLNAKDSAQCVVQMGFYKKNIRMSTLEAVKLAFENNIPIEVPAEILKADDLNLNRAISMHSKAYDSVFAPKFIERDLYNGTEVIM
jgi:bifunctional DNase/RNase